MILNRIEAAFCICAMGGPAFGLFVFPAEKSLGIVGNIAAGTLLGFTTWIVLLFLEVGMVSIRERIIHRRMRRHNGVGREQSSP
jgi:hypothetical protein